MSQKKIFVGNLSWKATEAQLRALFEQYGEVVSVKIVMDTYSGRSKGFGFVEMATPEAATKAINGLNEKLLDDRPLRLSVAQERSPNQGGGRGGPRESREGGGRNFRSSYPQDSRY